jgi:hypothetical protein
MNGTPTHYHRADGVAVTIKSYIHLFSEHYQAGNNAGLALLEFQEQLSPAHGAGTATMPNRRHRRCRQALFNNPY